MTPLLEDQLRAALQAHASDVFPSGDLAETAQARAVRLRRTKRAQLAAGVIVIAGAVAVIPWLTSLGPLNDSAPPVQPTPAISAEPVPDSVLNQARETRALLGTPTTVVDGTGSEVLTVPVANKDSVQGGINQLGGVWRAAGGYVVFLSPNLRGDMSPADADPVSLTFVRPDGSMTRLGSPESASPVVLSPDGSLVAFVAAGSPGTEQSVIVTNLSGRTLHQRTMPALRTPRPGSLLSLSSEGLWFLDPEVLVPVYWDFASDLVTGPAFPDGLLAAVLSGDQLVMNDGRGLRSYDVSEPAAPRLLWSKRVFAYWVVFDGSGTRLLVSDASTDQALLLDAATGREQDRVELGPPFVPSSWNPNNRWLAHAELDAPLRVVVDAVTPDSEGSLSVTQTSYPPYEYLYGLPVYALIGNELPPPTPGR